MKIDPKRCIVFFDFDNTITTCDVLDDMLLRFSEDKRWIALEKQWQSGLIGSRLCLEGQIKGLKVARKELDSYLSGIKLDPYFKKLSGLLKSKGIKTLVLSDNFDYILKRIFDYNEIGQLEIYSNKITLSNQRLKPRFPFSSKLCPACAHCKTKNILKNVNKDSIIVYIGDGHSDTCPARYADVVFAKADLLNHRMDNNLHCLSYKSLKDVYSYFKRSL